MWDSFFVVCCTPLPDRVGCCVYTSICVVLEAMTRRVEALTLLFFSIDVVDFVIDFIIDFIICGCFSGTQRTRQQRRGGDSSDHDHRHDHHDHIAAWGIDSSGASVEAHSTVHDPLLACDFNHDPLRHFPCVDGTNVRHRSTIALLCVSVCLPCAYRVPPCIESRGLVNC